MTKVGLLFVDNNLFHYCYFDNDQHAIDILESSSYKICAVFYECQDDGWYRIIKGIGDYQREPFPDSPRVLS